MIDTFMNGYGFFDSGTDDLLLPHVLTDDNSIGFGNNVESLTEGSWPFDQPSTPNGSTPMATLYVGSYYPEPEPPTPPGPLSDCLYLEAADSNSVLSLVGYTGLQRQLQYSSDGVNWTTWNFITDGQVDEYDELTLSAGERLYFRGNTQLFYAQFTGNGRFYSGGKLTSLLGENVTSVTDFALPYCFSNHNMWVDDSDEYHYTDFVLLTPPDTSNIISLGKNAMAGAFLNQRFLINPCNFDSLIQADTGSFQWFYMGCQSLTSASDFPLLTWDEQIGVDPFECMYVGCTFKMSDDGVSLNFQFPLPSDFVQEEIEYLASQFLGNANGFSGFVGVFAALKKTPDVRVYRPTGGQAKYPFLLDKPYNDGYDCAMAYWEKMGEGNTVQIDGVVFYPPGTTPEYRFSKWQIYQGGEWVDLTTTNPYDLPFSQDGEIKYVRFVYEPA